MSLHLHIRRRQFQLSHITLNEGMSGADIQNGLVQHGLLADKLIE
jgi:hypothetical protein